MRSMIGARGRGLASHGSWGRVSHCTNAPWFPRIAILRRIGSINGLFGRWDPLLAAPRVPCKRQTAPARTGKQLRDRMARLARRGPLRGRALGRDVTPPASQ